MARPKSSKSGHEPVEDSVTVATDPTPSPPTTRKKAAADAAATVSPKKAKKHGRSKSKSRHSHDDSNDSDDDNKLGTVVVEKAEKTHAKTASAASTATRSSKRVASTTKKELDKSLRKAKKVVNEMADTFDASPTWPLPGALSQTVTEKSRVVRDIVLLAVSSSLLSVGGRLTLGWLATSWSQTWISWASYFSTAGPPGVLPFTASVAARIVRLTASWGSTGNLTFLQALSFAPIIYLLTSYYNVPFPAAFLLKALDVVAEQNSLAAYRYLKGTSEDGNKVEDNHDLFAAILRDPVTFWYPYVFATVIYGSVLVQACRFFLPTTMVVHFLGIATVEPARVHSILPSSAPSLYDVFSAVFLSFSALFLNFLCGISSRDFIFGSARSSSNSNSLAATSFSRSAAVYRRTVALRAVAASLSVGLSIFSQCLFGIPGVDAVGAATFASIWAVAPLLVGVGLGYTGI